MLARCDFTVSEPMWSSFGDLAVRLALHHVAQHRPLARRQPVRQRSRRRRRRHWSTWRPPGTAPGTGRPARRGRGRAPARRRAASRRRHHGGAGVEQLQQHTAIDAARQGHDGGAGARRAGHDVDRATRRCSSPPRAPSAAGRPPRRRGPRGRPCRVRHGTTGWAPRRASAAVSPVRTTAHSSITTPYMRTSAGPPLAVVITPLTAGSSA